MASATAYAFWTCALLVAYTYLLYPCLLFVVYALSQARTDLRYLTRRDDRRRLSLSDHELPPVTLVIPAYNEEGYLKDKITNIRDLDYPRDRLHVVFVSDGSTDQTNDILADLHDPIFETVVLHARAGKWAAVNEGVRRARHDLLVMSDAATLFQPDAIRQLVRHFRDARVGVVCGALRFRGGAEFKQTEGIYWRYETMLRLMEARLGATLTASGAIYALRRECYRPLTPDDVIDDFVVPMRARKLGFRVVFDPEAEAAEFAGDTVKDEFTRRVRLAVGSFRALPELSRVPMDAIACFSFFSHKFLRWVLPFLLIGMLASNLFLLGQPLYRLTLSGQLAVYLWATLGLVFRERVRRVPLVMFCYYLMAINVAFLVGFVRFIGGRRETAWQRVS
jgi:cellulose synthase/poly-beta-1,6-N-acetylglucosamine synthase-like glycosyltransferase